MLWFNILQMTDEMDDPHFLASLSILPKSFDYKRGMHTIKKTVF